MSGLPAITNENPGGAGVSLTRADGMSAFLFSQEWKTAIWGRRLRLGGLADEFLTVPGNGRSSFSRAAIADDLQL